MPMMTNEASEVMKRDRAEAEPTTTEQAEPSGEAEAVSDEPTEAEGGTEAEGKPKRSRKRDKVAVA